jgi:hypothetical protein
LNSENFAEWLRRQGHDVIRSESSYWYNAGPRVYQACPYHWLIQPSEKELRGLMWKKGILALRYSTPLETPEGMASYHVILQGQYNLDMLRNQARNGVKNGMKHFKIEQIPLCRLADEGWKLQLDTLERQGRTSSMSQAEWQRICQSAEDLPGYEAWAATCEGELAATVLICRIDDWYAVPYAQSHRQYLNKHVNNILFYSVCIDLLARPGVNGIFFCLHSLDAPSSVDEFKFRMSLIPRPVRQRIVFHPLLKPLTNWTVHSALARLVKRYPENYILAKAEGMLRFHLKGRRPLADQEWPEILEEEKDRLLASLPVQEPRPVEKGSPLAAG